MTDAKMVDPIQAIAVLDEPNRARLYELIASSGVPLGRDDAAAALGISRELAAFHLDRLVAVGLLETEYRRRGVRKGPGGGRPAKLYRRAAHEVAVSLPERHYDVAADDMATALERLSRGSANAVAATVARERGMTQGRIARRAAGRRHSLHQRTVGLLDVLHAAGYEPQVDPATKTVTLRNCPYHAVAASHRDLTCNMNLGWAEGLVEGLDAPVTVELAPDDGRCCVLFHVSPTGRGGG
jgi:predicted ArsR family transcriptional regulator